LRYAVQPRPDGIAQALLFAREFIAGERVALVLGDNIFHGEGFTALLHRAAVSTAGAVIFAYAVSDPGRYGVIEFDADGKARAIVEKPKTPPSPYVVTGLYFYDARAAEIAATLKPSARGELEITDVNNHYLREGRLTIETLGRGFAWLDTGTIESFADASNFIGTIEARQGFKVSCPEEIAWRQGWIDDARVRALAAEFKGNGYGRYLEGLLHRR
jgi:glucose-1-phosphate thymidylyltransferase